MDDDAILTLQEVAALLKIGKKTAYTMVQQGELPAFRVRGQWRCRRADLEDWIAQQVVGTGRKTRAGGSRGGGKRRRAERAGRPAR